MVGAEGFEPPTLCSQSRCATRLRYAPNYVPIVSRKISLLLLQLSATPLIHTPFPEELSMLQSRRYGGYSSEAERLTPTAISRANTNSVLSFENRASVAHIRLDETIP